MLKIVSSVDIDGDAETKLFLLLIAQYVYVYRGRISFRALHVLTIYSIFGLENWCAMPTEAKRKRIASNIALIHSIMFPFFVQNIAGLDASLSLYSPHIIFYFHFILHSGSP